MKQPLFNTALMLLVFVILNVFTDLKVLILISWLFSFACIILLFKIAMLRAEGDILEENLQ